MSLSSDHDRAARRAALRAARVRRRRLALAGVLVAVVVVAGAVTALAGGGTTQQSGVHAEASSHAAGMHARQARTSLATHGTGAGARATGTPPLPPIAPAVPGTARVILHGPAKPEIALTFDDGFCPACVARIVRTLERTGAHATFFPNGVYKTSWDPQAAAIRRLVAKGQLTIGDHTFLHHDAVLESSDAFATDLSNDEAWIEKTFGVSARPFFRPPYGAYNEATLAEAGRQGFTKVINWSGTVADSSPRSITYIVQAVGYWAHPGSIILMHGNYPNTSIALPRILALLKARGLHPVTLKELLG